MAAIFGIGAGRRLDHAWRRLRPVTEDSEPLHACDRCRRVVAVSVRGVCPTLRCTRRLEEYKPTTETDGRLRRLYRTFDPVPLRAQEHTAQWTGEKAAEIQGEFVRGQINALSCSTTFELGVDVGELQAVVLRNMRLPPPTTCSGPDVPAGARTPPRSCSPMPSDVPTTSHGSRNPSG